MKFLCLKCEAYMTFRKVEQPGSGSLGVFFECQRCGAGFCMVTNAGETQLVSSLGVQLGGRSAPAAPLELTRGMLADTAAAVSPSAPPAEVAPPVSSSRSGAPAANLGKCPFASVVAGMSSPAKLPVTWSPEAEQRLNNIPEMVRSFARVQIEKMANERGEQEVTAALLDDARDIFMRMM